MTVPLASSCETVEGLLTGPRKLSIPYFQRGYAWREEHADRLVSDLVSHAQGKGGIDWYPLGAVILAHRPGATHADVADGHQRLITLTMLIAVLRDLEDDGELRQRLGRCILDADASLRFSTAPGTSDLLRTAVQEPGAAARELDTSTLDLSPSEVALLDNRALLIRRLAAMTPAERRRLSAFLLDRTLLVTITVAEENAARLLFATMHETGVKPQTADLLKSRILGRCPSDMRDRAQTAWENLESRLGRDRMEGLLRNLAAIEARTLATEQADMSLSPLFDFESADDAGRFVLDHLRPLGARHVEMHNAGLDPAAMPGPVFRRLQYLSWVIRHETWRLPALHWLSTTDYEHPDTLPFLTRLEALAWVQMIKPEEPYRRDKRYLAVLDEIDRGTALAPGGSLEVLAAERAAVRSVLTGPNLARRPYKLFLLLRLNAIYDGAAAVTVTPEATMEHIFPQRPAANSPWIENDRQSTDGADLRHVLGNLTLLTEAEQNRAGNREFDIKRTVYATSAFHLTRRVAAASQWRAEEIRARTEALADDFLADLGLTAPSLTAP